MTSYIILAAVLYVIIMLVIIAGSFIQWHESKEFDDVEAMRGARRIFIAPIWPVLVIKMISDIKTYMKEHKND